MSEPHPAVAAILAVTPLVALGGSDGEAARIAAALLRWLADNPPTGPGGAWFPTHLRAQADEIEEAHRG